MEKAQRIGLHAKAIYTLHVFEAFVVHTNGRKENQELENNF